MFTWCRFWDSLYEEGYEIIAIDSPGFGRSEGRTGQANLWRCDDGKLVVELLEAFEVKRGRCHVMGQCMGAAMGMRGFVRGSEYFSGSFVFHNATIGLWEKEFEEGKGRVLAWHEVDGDHMREAVGYKNFKRMAKEDPKYVTYIDNEEYRRSGKEEEVLDLESVSTGDVKISRTDSVSYKDPRPETIERVVDFFSRPPINKKAALKSSPLEKLNVTAIEDSKVDASSRVNVYIKVRPFLKRESDKSCISKITDTAITVKGLEYKFSKIITNETAADDYFLGDSTNFWEPEGGGTKIVFAYGQTGSGKSSTIRQIIRSLETKLQQEDDVFQPESLMVKYVQIYNENLLDMLHENRPINRLEDAIELSYGVNELTKVVELTNERHRTTSSTGMDDTSSRSHSLLYISVPGGSTLCIVDLAGNERISRSGVTGQQLTESININSSLSHLIRSLNSTIDTKSKFIPTRDSLLTTLLSPVFKLKCQVTLLACISPCEDNVRETISTLKFAAGGTYVGARKKKKRAKDGFKKMTDDEVGSLRLSREKSRGLSVRGKTVNELGIFVRGMEMEADELPEVEGEGEDVDVEAEAPGETNLVMLHYYGSCAVEIGSRCCWSDGELLELCDGLRLGAEAGGRVRVIVPDLPGHGKSLGTISSKPMKDNLSDICKTFLEPLLDHFGCDSKTVIYGYDFGAGLAMSATQVLANRFKGLIVHNGSYRLSGNETLAFRKGFVREVLWTDSLWHTKEKALMFGRLLLSHLKGLKKDMQEKKIRKLSEEEVVMKIAAVVEKVARIS
ncbi:hypothetical protein TrST_g2680 [Triparma strigata]|nr:hypothetical protein TrST_g2680 [Triparma strigata]